MKITHSKFSTINYDQITNCIYIGNDQCCQMHFKKCLLKKGIRADISLEEERVDHAEGVDYFLWIPTPDHFAPKPKQLLCGVKFIKYLVDNNIKMYVHCREGMGRAPTLVAAYLILEGMTTDQAISFIKKKRKAIKPTNKQINALKRFEKRVRKFK